GLTAARAAPTPLPAQGAHRLPGQGVPARAGGGLLGLRLPADARHRPRARLPREGPRPHPGGRGSSRWRGGGRGFGPCPAGVRAPADPPLAALARSPYLRPRRLPADEGREALRTGKIALLVEPGPPLVFHFDETRPDSRIARLEAADALERAAGRRDAVPVREVRVTEKGARY